MGVSFCLDLESPLEYKTTVEITFYGAVREVTGSAHLMTAGKDRVLLECGLYQGRRRECEVKNRTFPFDPGSVTNLVLSHAHIDHSGRIPLLAKKGFRERIIATRATRDACRHLLLDSAHIQEADARYLNYKAVRSFLVDMKRTKKKAGVTNREVRAIKKLLKKNAHDIDAAALRAYAKRYRLKNVEPLYTKKDAEDSLEQFEGYPYEHPIAVGQSLDCRLYDAGHILGSSFVALRSKGRKKTLFFTGDMGRFGKPIIENPTLVFPEEDRRVDLLVMECTYGNRTHDRISEVGQSLGRVVSETIERGGSLIIPAFAFGRTQEILYTLHELYREGKLPRIPVYVDSPLAANITKVYGEHPEVFNREAHKTFLEKGENPFSFPQIRFVGSVEESMALMKMEKPHIVIAGSGMCEFGRVVHHLRYKIHNPANAILIVGFMAENTLGRRLVEAGRRTAASGRRGRPPLLRFLGKKYPLRARVVTVNGLSAHADRRELIRFLKESNLVVKRIALVHGEEDQAEAFSRRLKREGYAVTIPRMGETIPV